MRLEGWHIVIIIVLAIVLFGAPKLPGLARSVGQSLRIFKSEVKQMKDENNSDRPSGTDPVEGRVMDGQQTYTPTYQNPSPHQGTEPPRYSADPHVENPGQAGAPRQSGTPHTNP
ncbi:Sec-independent protein translocase subunit TatA [Arthrobacter sp. RIT-PI-e]|uniref:Sec-independent protein translocase subunit TatA n=1 Tax=Arthrobacter sp. RIT-PI-e TaxID=1681197 RepID=UPI0009E245B6|nr:Sec-independent protein translocase subunit TatA [Arthrobacter sp. RIT-PI-e]